MIIRLTSKRQVTFPKRVMEKLQLKAGDSLELSETKDGFLIKPRRFSTDNLAPLKNIIPEDYPDFEIETIRNEAHDPRLRD